MKKLLKPRDILLLGLTHALDIFEEIKDPLHLVSKSYKSMYGWVPEQYKKHKFNHLIWRTLKAGYIEKIEKKGEVYIRITSQGAKATQRDFPLLHLQNKPWDGKWRLVMFDIAEIQKSKRDFLRDKLKELGFGMLQKSVFITPHDIVKDFSEYVESINLEDSIDILETSYMLRDPKKLAERVWKLTELNEKYLEILKDAEKIKNSHLTTARDRGKRLNIKTKKLNDEIKEIRERYVKILLRDPFLPSMLLPKDYARYRLGKLLKELF